MIKLENKLQLLTDSLVPEVIRTEAPQFYALVEAFLVNIQEVQDSINNNFLDTIDLTKIKSTEIKKIYIRTYLAMLNLEDEDNIDGILDLVKVNKELSMLKGTALLFTLLTKLLVYLIPSINTQYNDLLTQYENATGVEKVALEQELEAFKLANLDAGSIIVDNLYDINDDVIPFKYSVISDFDAVDFYKYIYPFSHPAGWLIEFTNAYTKLLSETVSKYELFTLHDTIDYPIALADGSVDVFNTDDLYPDNVISDPLLGLEADLATISDNIFNTSRLYIDTGNVYYRYKDLNGPVISGITTKYSIDTVQSTPADNNMYITGGGYTAETTGIASANGALDAGHMMLTYESRTNDLLQ